MSQAIGKAIIKDANGYETPINITYNGIRTKTNQFNQDNPVREIRGTVMTSTTFDQGSIVTIGDHEYKVTYFNNAIRPANITLTDNVIGL